MAMKAVVDGVRYDTETAVMVARVSENLGTPYSYSGTLYVTPRSRRWFICGEGGPYSMFGQKVGNAWVGSPGLFPVSKADARDMLEHGDDECHRALDAYAEELGVVDADSLPVAV
jgi:hypothetical protein